MRLSEAAVAVATCLTVGLSHAPARADEAGDKALMAVEAAMNKAASHYFEYDATKQQPGQPEQRARLIVRMKGVKRLAEFTAPAELKGTKVLVLSPTQMYVYLPAFGKVRRIASHTRDADFLGMDYNQDDLAQQRFSDQYSAVVSDSTDQAITLTLTPRPGVSADYGRIEMVVSIEKPLPTEIRYYTADGKRWKTETRSGYSCESDICTPATLKMVNHVKSTWTSLSRTKWKVNETFDDDIFSKRNLER